MLDIKNMQKVTETNAVFERNSKELYNMQTINEHLLRTAVKNCELYATDILHLINLFEKYILVEQITEIEIYFRQAGVNWQCLDGFTEDIPDLHRYVMKLVYNPENGYITLYEAYGNC
jgi:hypothetical protein